MANKRENTVKIIRPPRGLHLNINELWKYRELFYFFTWRDIKVRYRQSILGIAWALIQPLVLMLVFVFFFAQSLEISTDGIIPPLFYLSGLLLWNFFSQGAITATQSIVNHSATIKKVYFPRILIPSSSILTALFDFLIAFVILILLVIYYKVSGEQIVLLKFSGYYFISLFIVLLTTCGLGFLLSALNGIYRDFRHMIPFLIQLLFFVSPVIYPLSVVKQVSLKYLLALNPLTGALELMRAAIHQQAILPGVLLISIISAIALFALGLLVFNKLEPKFADIV